MAHDLSDFEWTCMHITRCGFLKCYSDYITRKYLRRNRTQAIAEYLGSASDPKKPTGKSSYHPSEDIRAYVPEKNPGDSRLSPPETARTIIEVLLYMASSSQHFISKTILGLMS
jgi:hypothetical protein